MHYSIFVVSVSALLCPVFPHIILVLSWLSLSGDKSVSTAELSPLMVGSRIVSLNPQPSIQQT